MLATKPQTATIALQQSLILQRSRSPFQQLSPAAGIAKLRNFHLTAVLQSAIELLPQLRIVFKAGLEQGTHHQSPGQSHVLQFASSRIQLRPATALAGLNQTAHQTKRPQLLGHRRLKTLVKFARLFPILQSGIQSRILRQTALDLGPLLGQRRAGRLQHCGAGVRSGDSQSIRRFHEDPGILLAKVRFAVHPQLAMQTA